MINNTPEQTIDSKDLTERFGHQPGDQLIVVHISQQQLCLYANDLLVHCWPVSSALNGTGCTMNSFKTPTGVHRIAEMIGDDAKPGTVFRGRVATEQRLNPADHRSTIDEDLITSRIMWLEGMEPGVNRGGELDSHDRYIYIHGTADEARIGQAVSHGCIRMTNADVIALFDQVKPGTLVIIQA